jgi:two-component system cell cycle sensor histidine kinase/response regulator CckA
VLARLFEPFFTTKSTDRGTGLGLITVREIARSAGGDVHVDSHPAGTAVSVFWPGLGAGAPVETSESVLRRGCNGSETILLVEDDPSVRSVVSQLLVANGYSVLEATDGFEALSISARFEAPIDLLIADVVMPHMSGPALAGKLLRRRPALKVLYISGYPEERTGLVTGPADFLPKPFTSARLTEKVRTIIGARAG